MNPRQTSRASDLDVTPKRFAETTPPQYQGSDFSFTLQGVIELQRTVGKLEHAVEVLTTESRDQGNKLDRLNQIIVTAAAILAIAIAVGGFIINKAADVVIQHYSAPPVQTTQSPPISK